MAIILECHFKQFVRNTVGAINELYLMYCEYAALIVHVIFTARNSNRTGIASDLYQIFILLTIK